MNPEKEPPQTPFNQNDPSNPPQSTPASPSTSWQQPNGTAPVAGGTTPTSSGLSSSRKGLLLGIALVALLALAGVAAAVYFHASKPLAKVAQSPTTTTPIKPATPSANDTKQTIPVDQTITDDTMGITIKVISVDIGKVAIPAKYQDANSDKTVVTADVSITSQGKYALSLGSTQLDIIDATGQSNPSTSVSDSDLKALGLPVLADQSSDTSVSGYVAYWVPTSNLSKLTLRYTRQAAGVIGSGQTIPKKTYDIVVR